MKKLFYLSFISISCMLQAQETSSPSMKSPFRDPVVEEGERNIILQNRCGNRLTMLFYPDRTDIEISYKPNAFRRKEFRARNFSNRDNQTILFPKFVLNDIRVGDVVDFDYDPFFTRIGTFTSWKAKNTISIVNLADENAFAISSSSPLLLAFKPHHKFEEQDGLLSEKFVDRGEEIVSFVRFSSYEQNRFRVLTDGTYILQLYENEVILVGGEENNYQVDRILRKYEGLDLKALLYLNENILAPGLNNGLVHFNDSAFQKVIDLNQRIVYSGMDEGGACFGALNRIYNLIWLRDGSMTSSLCAAAGNPSLIKHWAPFALENPSIMTREDGTKIPEFLQILGSRWTKKEPDGIYYATLSAYTYFMTTGEDDLLYSSGFSTLLDAIDYFLKNNWDPANQMIVTNTIGESPLEGDPVYGYDAVNGNFERTSDPSYKIQNIRLAASLYNQVNTYNLLLMAGVLLQQQPALDKGRITRYTALADSIVQTLQHEFYDKKNDCLFFYYFFTKDNKRYAEGYDELNNPWEDSWASALGPFFPLPQLQLKTARKIAEKWPLVRPDYGYCPWNMLSSALYEYGMNSADYRKMLLDEVSEALQLTRKYPMRGGLTEYRTQTESWRPLPFTYASFKYSLSGQLVKPLPMGMAVRASMNVDRIENFRYRLSKINVLSSGAGDQVSSWSMNGIPVSYTLQVPLSYLLPGINNINVQRGYNFPGFRLYSSSAELIDCRTENGIIRYTFYGAATSQLIFENYNESAELKITDDKGKNLDFTNEEFTTQFRILQIHQPGRFEVQVKLAN
jgi:hypothetical protein